MSDNSQTNTNRGTTDSEHDVTDASTTESEQSLAIGGSPLRDDKNGTGTTSSDQQDAVSEGRDGYEYHTTTASDRELHGNDLRDSVLVGAAGDDKLVGGNSNDVLDGAEGNNTLDGGSGNDVLVAGGETNRGQNHLNGGSGDDVLVAGGTKTHALDDFLKANPTLSTTIAGDARYASLSTLVKGATDDTGGGASNVFELASANGNDSIFNFHVASDKLEIHRGLNGSDIQDTASLVSHIRVSGNDVTLELGNGNSVTLVGVDVGHLTAANLVWL